MTNSLFAKMSTQNVDKLAEDVSYLRKDMAVVGALVDRLDTTIDKLTDISNSVSNLLAVHETKLTSQEIVSKQLSDLVETRRMETEDKIKQEMARWSAEVKDRYYFELKINTFLKNEITRLETEVLRLRNENEQMKIRMESMSIPKKQNVSADNMLEID